MLSADTETINGMRPDTRMREKTTAYVCVWEQMWAWEWVNKRNNICNKLPRSATKVRRINTVNKEADKQKGKKNQNIVSDSSSHDHDRICRAIFKNYLYDEGIQAKSQPLKFILWTHHSSLPTTNLFWVLLGFRGHWKDGSWKDSQDTRKYKQSVWSQHKGPDIQKGTKIIKVNFN